MVIIAATLSSVCIITILLALTPLEIFVVVANYRLKISYSLLKTLALFSDDIPP